MKQLGKEFRGEMAFIVSDIYDVTADQVRRWVRQRLEILEKFHCIKMRGKSRIRKKQLGRFARAEEIVHEQFVHHRKQGRPIGPKFLRQAMRREVQKIAADDQCDMKVRIAARAFRGGSTWLQRFCRRWGMCLRRKTNVKKIPIEERAKKIKRWMAIFRLYLRSFQARLSPLARHTSAICHKYVPTSKPSMATCRPRPVGYVGIVPHDWFA